MVQIPSKLPVSLAIHTNPENIAALSGNTISILGVGVVIISASQHGNDNFNAATDIADTFSIVKANQLISITSLPDLSIWY
jgi:hypothetical protein